MNMAANWPALGIAGAVLALITSLITAIATIKVNQANVAKLQKEAKKIGDDAEKSKADTAAVFNGIADAWTKRILQSNERLEGRMEKLVTVLENLTDAVDHVAPMLDRITETPDEVARVFDLRTAASAGRRAI